MSQNDNLILGKNMENDSINIQQKREKLIEKIMEKYDVSYENAEKIFIKIEENNNNIKKSSKPTKPVTNIDNNLKKVPNSSNELKSKSNVIPESKTNIQDKQIYNDKIITTAISQINASKNTVKKENVIDYNPNTNSESPQEQHLVDSIMEDIIPEYNQNISIELNHVDLTFEVSNEKVDTLKESFIRTLKRNKAKKIKVQALKDISFKIYKGEKVGIIGYNGAGKSTLLRVITGVYAPDKGDVKTNGKISPLLSLGAGFDHNFSGRKNIFLNGAVLGYDKSFLNSKVDEIIEFSELGEFIDIPIKNYSSGMMAKLGFSIATAVNPDILIIDEVLGVGDITFRKKSSDKIKSLMGGGTTVLLVSHSIPQVRELCDKAIWIDNGRIREIGEVNKICDEYLKDSEKASNEQLANIQFK